MIPYVVRGEGSPVLFLHGFALDSRMWQPQIDALHQRHRSVAVDLPGFGAQPATRDVSAARAALEVLDALEIDRVHVVGHSRGGAVAMDFALAFPHRVRTLVLVSALMRGRDPKIAAWSQCAELARAGKTNEAMQAWLADPLFATSLENASAASQIRAMGNDYRGAHWRGEISTTYEAADPPNAKALAQAHVSTLVVIGEKDLPPFRAMADEYEAGLPHARKVVIAGAGHVPNLEAVETFNAALVEFFAS